MFNQPTHPTHPTPPNSQSDTTSTHFLRPARGMAMLMVLAAVVVAAIVSYAVLSTASLSVQSRIEQRDAIRKSGVAEDGARLAMHYLLEPGELEAANLSPGLDNAVFWAGANNVHLGNDSTQAVLADITVVNPSAHVYDIVSMSTTIDGTTQQVRARVRGVPNVWKTNAALQTNSASELSSGIRVSGDIWTDANFTASGVVTGVAYSGGTKPPAATGDPVPAFEELALVKAAENGGWYTYNGASCRGDFIYGTSLLLAPIPNLDNTGRVFFYTGTEPLTLSLSLSNFSGTIVVLNSSLHLKDKNAYITPRPGLPGLIVRDDIKLLAQEELRVNGLLYLGGVLSSSDSAAIVRVTGAILHSGPASAFLKNSGSFHGLCYAIFNATNANVPGLLSSDLAYRSLTVESWDRE